MIMKPKSILLYLMMAILLSTAVTISCSKQTEDLDELMVYAPSGNSTYNISTGNIFVLRNEIVSSINTVFPIYLTRPFTEDVKLKAVIDTSYLAVYDKQNNTTSPIFKATAFALANDGNISIPMGKVISVDSVRVLAKDTVGLDLTKTYIIPIRLSNSDRIPISEARKVIYVKASFVRVTASLPTALLVSRPGYTASLAAGPTIGFPITINTTNTAKPVSISVMADMDLVASYNQANNTTFQPLPTSTFKLLSNKVTILPEKTTSLDSIKIQLPTLTGLTAGTSYLLPITLKEDSEVYIQATAKTRYIQIVPTLAEARIPATGTSNILDVAMEISPTGSVAVNSMIGFTAAVNNALASKSKVTVVEDASLLAAYNTTNARTAIGFPSGSYSLLKGSVDILAGSATSGLDSIKVELKTLNQFQAGKEYVLPLKIVAPETSNIPAGSSNNVLYLRIIPKLNNIDPTNKGLTGTTMSRTGWIATALNQFSTTTYAANKALDNINTTSWLSANSALPVWWQVDMGAEKTVKGFSITPNYTSSISYNFLTMEVLTSNDGVNWTSQGSYRGGVTAASSSATNPDYKTVKFLEPVKARYYRFSITAKTSTYSAIGEVNAIE